MRPPVTKTIIVLELLGHPPSVLVAYILLIFSGAVVEISTNVFLSIPFLFIPLILLFGWLRWKLFLSRISDGSQEDVRQSFMKANLLALPGVILFILLSFPVEGNVFGFVYLPIALLAVVVLSPIIWWQSRRQIKRLNACSGEK